MPDFECVKCEDGSYEVVVPTARLIAVGINVTDPAAPYRKIFADA